MSSALAPCVRSQVLPAASPLRPSRGPHPAGDPRYDSRHPLGPIRVSRILANGEYAESGLALTLATDPSPSAGETRLSTRLPGPVSAFPHSLGSRRRWAASATLVLRRRPVCFVCDTPGFPSHGETSGGASVRAQGALTCPSYREPSGKARFPADGDGASRRGEVEPGLSVPAVSQKAKDSERTKRVSRIVPRGACQGGPATRSWR